MEKSKHIWAQLDEWSIRKIPFVFLLDFELKKPLIYRLDSLPSSLKFEIDSNNKNLFNPNIYLNKFPIPKEVYSIGFNKIVSSINRGDSFLLNYTARNEITTNADLAEIYKYSFAKFKIFLEEEFVCFSPERFVEIKDNIISTYPMKGTIDATIPNAKHILINDPKEKAEHATIVDLLRNDISQVARNVTVDNFGFIEKIKTNGNDIFQMSSKISGKLINQELKIGTIFSKLLPAGSVSGAPKEKTLEIIKDAENMDRGYYTGVFGYFDGTNFDSAVMIRYIEKIKNKLYFYSGGGITHQSNLDSEYQELINKIYVPIYRNHSDRKRADSTVALPQQTV